MPLLVAQMTAQPNVDHLAFMDSDDESIQRLAALIKHRDNRKLEELVSLIGQLSVPIIFA